MSERDYNREIAEAKGWWPFDEKLGIWDRPSGELHSLPDWSGDLNKAAELLIEMNASLECDCNCMSVFTRLGRETTEIGNTVQTIRLAICEAYLVWKGAR